MGVEVAIAAAGAGLSLMGSEMAASGVREAGRYNKAIADRNADVADNRAQMRVIESGREIVRFREEFRELNAASGQAMRKNGTVISGTALDVLLNNALEAESDIQTIAYNAAADASDLREKGVNERLRGELANYESKAQAKAMRIQGLSNAFSTGYSIYTA
jgi:hypothetical protein